MCDYSLAHYPNRLAVEREQLVVHRFSSGTLGLASPSQNLKEVLLGRGRSAVCVPPGARLRLHDIPEHIQTSLGVGAVEEVTFVERGVEAFVHRDSVRFSNDRQVLLQNLRVGQNWEAKIAEFIKRVDYFIFVQTQNMDQLDARNEDGVYNRELKLALERQEDRPYGAVFVLHVTVGPCQTRPGPALTKIHRFRLDAEHGIEALASQILDAFATTPDKRTSERVAQVS